MSHPHIVLGSRSQQRKSLLSQLLPNATIEICPPLDSDEAGFEGLVSRDEVLQRLTDIASRKLQQVAAQCSMPDATIICADTTIIATEPESRSIVVLGQPPDSEWQEVVRGWFQKYYSGRTHEAVTAVIIQSRDRIHQFQVATEVRFASVTAEQLDWYIATGEPQGKAGGYALQGAGSLFVESVKGSLSNVVGLPLLETWLGLRSLNAI